jgi:uncharacterized membrane protein
MFIILLAFGIGFVAGLRSMTAPAAVCWAAYLDLLRLEGSPLAFMGSVVAVGIFSVLALAELLADKVPLTPSRLRPGSLLGRIAAGALSGACIAVSSGQSLVAGAVPGGAAAVVGALAGYHARKNLVARLKVKDTGIALLEDGFTIGLACLILSRL